MSFSPFLASSAPYFVAYVSYSKFAKPRAYFPHFVSANPSIPLKSQFLSPSILSTTTFIVSQSPKLINHTPTFTNTYPFSHHPSSFLLICLILCLPSLSQSHYIATLSTLLWFFSIVCYHRLLVFGHSSIYG